MLNKLGISDKEWKKYWHSIKDYRDKSLAHHESAADVPNYPDFDNALVVCMYYYAYLIKELRARKVHDYPDDLENYYKDYLAQSIRFTEVACRSTTDFKDIDY